MQINDRLANQNRCIHYTFPRGEGGSPGGLTDEEWRNL